MKLFLLLQGVTHNLTQDQVLIWLSIIAIASMLVGMLLMYFFGGNILHKRELGLKYDFLNSLRLNKLDQLVKYFKNKPFYVMVSKPDGGKTGFDSIISGILVQSGAIVSALTKSQIDNLNNKEDLSIIDNKLLLVGKYIETTNLQKFDFKIFDKDRRIVGAGYATESESNTYDLAINALWQATIDASTITRKITADAPNVEDV